MTSSPQNSPLSELNELSYVLEPDLSVAYRRTGAFVSELRKEGISHRYLREAAFSEALDMATSELVKPERELLLNDLRFVGTAASRCMELHDRLMSQYERHFGQVPDHGSETDRV